MTELGLHVLSLKLEASSDLGSLWLFGCLFVNVLDGWRYGQKQIKCICPATTVVSHLQHFFKLNTSGFLFGQNKLSPAQGALVVRRFSGGKV